MFERFFKPKWRHVNADIRKQAIAKLNSKSPEDYDIILQLAKNDESVDVRRTAIESIDKLADLVNMLRGGQSSNAVEDALYHRISILLCMSEETPIEEKLSVLDQVKEPSVFRYVVKNGQQVDLQVAATELVSDEETLEDFALHAKSVKVRQTAVEKISSPNHLRLIEQASRSKDKTVYRIAREKLAEQKEAIERNERETREVMEVVEAIERHASLPADPLYSNKLELLVKQWKKLPSLRRESLQERWKVAEDRCLAAIEQWQSTDFGDDIVSSDNAQEEQTETLSILSDALAFIKAESDPLQLDLPALQGVLTTQQVRWGSATEFQEAQPEEQNRFDALIKEIGELIEPARRLKNSANQIETTLSEFLKDDQPGYQDLKGVIKKLEKLKTKLDWPVSLTKHSLVKSLEQALEKARAQLSQLDQKSKSEINQVKDKLEELETAIGDGQVKIAQKILSQVQDKLKLVDGDKTSQFNARLKRLQGQFRELKDWQGYANTPKKEALIDEMTQLIESDMPPPDKAQQIKSLQEAWRELGSAEAGKEQALWKAFKEAGDRAFEPCRAYFSDQAAQRKVNIEKRTSLVEQLESYEQNNDWGTADWPVVLETIKTARATWRSYSPVESKANKPLQKQFDLIVSKIQERLDDERDKNARLKDRLVEQANALIDSDDLNDAINRVKALQQEWKSIGVTHRKKDGAQWKAFRAACDKIFDMRSKAQESDEATKVGNQEWLQNSCERVEHFLEFGDDEVLATKADFKQMQADAEALGALPAKEAKALRKNWQNLMHRYQERLLEAQANQLQKSYEVMWEKADLCADLEEKILNAELSSEELIDLKEKWVALGELHGPAEASLNARFDLAISNSHLTEEALEAYRAMANKNGDTCRVLTIKMEVVAGVESPEEDQESRMQLQVERLSKGMVGKGDLEPNDEGRDIELQWCANGPVSAYSLEKYADRFRQALAAARG